MKIIIQDTAHNSLEIIFDYLANYSIINAIKTIEKIHDCIYNLEISPYLGKQFLKIKNENFRELILKQPRSSYRIIYYISESKSTVYVLYVANCKQNLNRILKIHNYFNSFKLI